jgi:Uma2 family endonuclease
MSDSLASRARPIKRVEYERMVEAGLFRGERLELWKGVLVPMAPQYSPHASTVQALTHAFVVALVPARRASVRVQLPIALSDDSEPEPDVAIVPWGDYCDAHPTTAHLIIEVAESSLKDDRGFKSEEYAKAGIPEYWIVNLQDRVVEVHRSPGRDNYRTQETKAIDARLSPLAFPDVDVAVSDIIRIKGH